MRVEEGLTPFVNHFIVEGWLREETLGSFMVLYSLRQGKMSLVVTGAINVVTIFWGRILPQIWYFQRVRSCFPFELPPRNLPTSPC